ncbi:MAG: hypothetical protein ACPIOQ_39650, partial [Promethearchaeia archaeon]
CARGSSGTSAESCTQLRAPTWRRPVGLLESHAGSTRGLVHPVRAAPLTHPDPGGQWQRV